MYHLFILVFILGPYIILTPLVNLLLSVNADDQDNNVKTNGRSDRTFATSCVFYSILYINKHVYPFSNIYKSYLKLLKLVISIFMFLFEQQNGV